MGADQRYRIGLPTGRASYDEPLCLLGLVGLYGYRIPLEKWKTDDRYNELDQEFLSKRLLKIMLVGHAHPRLRANEGVNGF